MMKIINFYKNDPHYMIDQVLHEGFMRKVAEDRNVESLMYGPNLHKDPKNKVLCQYDPKLSMDDLLAKFPADVFIVNTKSRCFDYYSPPTRGNEAKGLLLPPGFANCNKVLKVMIEEDFHYEVDDAWYGEMKFDLVLQRHCSQARRTDFTKTVRHEWFPFSVDTDIFKPNGNSRINKICFAGSLTPPYPDRIFACDALSREGLIDVYSNREKIGLPYVKCLGEYVAHLNGKSSVDITAAKCFEIMASGSVLFTNRFTGIDELFPEGTYVEWEENNIVEKAKFILKNPEYAKEIADNGLDCIEHLHTHPIRVRQLVAILDRELNGR